MRSFAVEEFLRYFMGVQPPCYAEWERKEREDLPGWTLKQMLDGAILGGCSLHGLTLRSMCLGGPDKTLGGPDEVIEGLYVSSSQDVVANSAECPIYQVSSGRFSTAKFPALLLPTLKELKVLVAKYLKGTELPATDHQFYRIDNGEKVKFPNLHAKDIMLHELDNILRKAGMRSGEFAKERERTDRWRKHVPRVPKEPLLSGAR
jgi:hypothetical protein